MGKKNKLVKIIICALVAAFSIVPSSAVSSFGLDFKASAAESFASPKGNPLKGIFDKIAQAKEDNPNNKGIVGWLTVTGTNIHEPICYTSQNNNHYLYRDIKGTNYPQIASYPNYKNYPDSVTYLDYRTQIKESFDSKGASRNYVLYGHNWNNLMDRGGQKLAIGNKPGYTMFAQLPSYTNMKFAEANPYIYFSTETSAGAWKVFSVAYCEVSTKFPYHVPFTDKKMTAQIINEWKDRTMYDFSTDVNEDDRILTLSTCTRQYDGVGSSQRFVVVARLLREGESTKDKVTVEVNKDMKKPNF